MFTNHTNHQLFFNREKNNLQWLVLFTIYCLQYKLATYCTITTLKDKAS